MRWLRFALVLLLLLAKPLSVSAQGIFWQQAKDSFNDSLEVLGYNLDEEKYQQYQLNDWRLKLEARPSIAFCCLLSGELKKETANWITKAYFRYRHRFLELEAAKIFAFNYALPPDNLRLDWNKRLSSQLEILKMGWFIQCNFMPCWYYSLEPLYVVSQELADKEKESVGVELIQRLGYKNYGIEVKTKSSSVTAGPFWRYQINNLQIGGNLDFSQQKLEAKAELKWQVLYNLEIFSKNKYERFQDESGGYTLNGFVLRWKKQKFILGYKWGWGEESNRIIVRARIKF
ncbi:hypothetical protein D6821_01950 [Candidatus Parcubacteria bacterium]|nr:MAG: hypothetical protein D6821_01950 [Candidatus Parcubacteria bacterium]